MKLLAAWYHNVAEREDCAFGAQIATDSKRKARECCGEEEAGNRRKRDVRGTADSGEDEEGREDEGGGREATNGPAARAARKRPRRKERRAGLQWTTAGEQARVPAGGGEMGKC